MGDEAESEEQGGEGDAGSVEDSNGSGVQQPQLRVWLSLVEAVAQMTNYNFREVYGLPIMEFFTYVAYIRYKRKMEEKQINDFRTRNKLR